MKTKNLTIQFNEPLKIDGTVKIAGWLHSDKENGKFSKVQKRFIKLEENNKFTYLGGKRFIKPHFVL
jgi:hypothetical protein